MYVHFGYESLHIGHHLANFLQGVVITSQDRLENGVEKAAMAGSGFQGGAEAFPEFGMPPPLSIETRSLLRPSKHGQRGRLLVAAGILIFPFDVLTITIFLSMKNELLANEIVKIRYAPVPEFVPIDCPCLMPALPRRCADTYFRKRPRIN